MNGCTNEEQGPELMPASSTHYQGEEQNWDRDKKHNPTYNQEVNQKERRNNSIILTSVIYLSVIYIYGSLL